LEEGGGSRVIMSKWPFVTDEIGPAGHHQSLGINKPTLATCIRLGDAMGFQGLNHQFANTDPGLARALEEDTLSAEFASGNTQGG